MGFNVRGTQPKPGPTWRATPKRRDARVWVLGLGLALALVATVGPEARGQVHRIKAELAVCRGGRCVLEGRGGSAVAIGRRTAGRELLLTAGHLVAGGTVRRLEVRLGDEWTPAALLAADPQLDLALVEIPSAPLRSVCLAEQKPGDGTPAMAAGFPDGSTTVASPTGRVLAFNNADVVRYQITTRGGMSGGALLAEDGQLLGIISAAGFARSLATGFQRVNDGTGYATSAPACRRFLIQTLGQVPDCRRPRPAAPPAPPAPPGKENPMTEDTTPPGPPPSPPPVQLSAELVAELKAFLRAELKARPADNTELTGDLGQQVIIVEGQPGPPGPPGRDGKDSAEDLAAILRRMDTMESQTEKQAAAVGILRTSINEQYATQENRWNQTADMIATTAEDLERLQTQLEDHATAADGRLNGMARRLAEAEAENKRQAAIILALEKFTREHRVTVQILDPSGQVIRQERFNINEPIQFRLTPRRPPSAADEEKRIGFSQTY